MAAYAHQQPEPAGAGDRGDLGAFAGYAQHPVAVLFTEVGDVGIGGFEDPQAQQAEHGNQGEVAALADSRAVVSSARTAGG